MNFYNEISMVIMSIPIVIMVLIILYCYYIFTED